jgi:hypothetical protein
VPPRGGGWAVVAGAGEFGSRPSSFVVMAAAAFGQRRSVGRAASPDGARCVADSGALLRLAGAVVPDGTGLMEVRGGTFAPEPVADPDLEAEDGAVPVPAEPPGFGCPLGVPVVIP